MHVFIKMTPKKKSKIKHVTFSIPNKRFVFLITAPKEVQIHMEGKFETVQRAAAICHYSKDLLSFF